LFSLFFLFEPSDFREKDFLLHVFELQFTSQKSSKVGFDPATRQHREREREKETLAALRRQTWNSRKQKAGCRRKTEPIFFQNSKKSLKKPVNLMKLLKTLKNSNKLTEQPKLTKKVSVRSLARSPQRGNGSQQRSSWRVFSLSFSSLSRHPPRALQLLW
jgi:hypothetical protein